MPTATLTGTTTAMPINMTTSILGGLIAKLKKY